MQELHDRRTGTQTLILWSETVYKRAKAGLVKHMTDITKVVGENNYPEEKTDQWRSIHY